MKIVVFGVGWIYKEYKKYILETDEITAFIDNDCRFWGTKIDGVTIHNPNDIFSLSFDKILLMSTHAPEMKRQLLKLGCKKEYIIRYVEYIDAQSAGELKIIFSKKEPLLEKKEKCLIITTYMGYNGGTLAAVYAALALQKKNYSVVIASPGGEKPFIQEMRKWGLDFIFYKNLNFPDWNELFWLKDFKYIIVNTLQMICCAIEIAKKRHVVLWLHEPSMFYKMMEYWKIEIEEGIQYSNLSICAVSTIAKENFFNCYFAPSVRLLPYGIPDEWKSVPSYQKESLAFAVVGFVEKRKGQDIFLDAVALVDSREEKSLFWMIGKNPNDEYGQVIENRARQYDNVRMIGELSRSKMRIYYSQIDIVVISSREETMSIVATEAMMLGKVCILANTIGMADYVRDGYDGLLFPTGDTKELAQKMIWCMENREELKRIGENARKTYQSKFTLEEFGKNIEKVIKEY